MRPHGCVPECPGCRYIQVSDQTELEQKTKWLQEKLSHWSDKIRPIQTHYPRLGQREKVALRSQIIKNKWEFGLTQYKDRKEIFIPIPECPVHSERVNQILSLLSELPKNLPMCQIQIIGQQLTLVLRAKKNHTPEIRNESLRFCDYYATQLKALNIEGIWINWHPQFGKWATSHKGWDHLWGERDSYHSTGEVYGPGGFGQVHWSLYQNALEKTRSFLFENQPKSYLELYCGIGVGARKWEQIISKKNLLGIELSAEAIAMAKRNAPHTTFLQGTCEQRLPQISNWYEEQLSQGNIGIFVNPPRSGLESKVVDWLGGLRNQRIAYMSCSPLSLAGDLKLLCTYGHKVSELIAFDFFPKTRHLEVLALITQNESV